MDFCEYVRKPFIVEGVEITKDNIEEVAAFVGEIKYKEDGTPFIQVDKRLVPNLTRVHIGFFMTRMGDHIRCYSKKVFGEQFIENEEQIQAWVDFLNNGGIENSRTKVAE